jgi:hypothetical protein
MNLLARMLGVGQVREIGLRPNKPMDMFLVVSKSVLDKKQRTKINSSFEPLQYSAIRAKIET